jgi:hypothetical protein
LTGFHQRADLCRKWRLRFLKRAKHVASRNLRQLQAFMKQARLRTFSSTRRTHQDYDFRHNEFSIADCQFPIGLSTST